MRRRVWSSIIAACAGVVLLGASGELASAQLALTPPDAVTSAPLPEPAAGVTIEWRVRNRFRLFRDERDFDRHVAAQLGRSILAAEQTLALESGGLGWARDMVARRTTAVARG